MFGTWNPHMKSRPRITVGRDLFNDLVYADDGLLRRITSLCRHMSLELRGNSVSVRPPGLVAKDQDPEPRVRPPTRHNICQWKPHRCCFRLCIPGKLSVIRRPVLSGHTETHRFRFRSNVLIRQHLERQTIIPVSYTHLTLPTKRIV